MVSPILINQRNNQCNKRTIGKIIKKNLHHQFHLPASVIFFQLNQFVNFDIIARNR